MGGLEEESHATRGELAQTEATLHSLTQSVMGGLEEESHATRGELAQTEATAARDQLDLIDSIRQPVQTVRSLIVHGRNLIALLSRPFYPAAVAFGAISSLLLPMTLLALFRGPTALDLNYSFALGLACLTGSATHDVVSGTASKLKSLNDAVFFNMSRSFVLTALIATIAFFVGNFLQKFNSSTQIAATSCLIVFSLGVAVFGLRSLLTPPTTAHFHPPTHIPHVTGVRRAGGGGGEGGGKGSATTTRGGGIASTKSPLEKKND